MVQWKVREIKSYKTIKCNDNDGKDNDDTSKKAWIGDSKEKMKDVQAMQDSVLDQIGFIIYVILLAFFNIVYYFIYIH